MTYGTSHLLIGGGWGVGVFSGGGSRKKYCCVKCVCVGGGGEGGSVHKNKNIRGVFYQLNLISKNGPKAKMRKKCKQLSNIAHFFPRSVRSLRISQNSYFWSS